MSKAAEFFWAQIAGADPEPVEMIEIDGRRGVLTIGCADLFWIDDPTAAVSIDDRPMRRPPNVFTKEQREAQQASYREQGRHGWRGPR